MQQLGEDKRFYGGDNLDRIMDFPDAITLKGQRIFRMRLLGEDKRFY
jgi:hypothetical protein